MPLKLSFGKVIRGDGKVYVTVRGVSSESDLTVCASFSDGGNAPVVLTRAFGIPIIVFPAFQCDINIMVEARDGAETNRISKCFTYRNAQFQSRLNTLTHNSEALSIRNCDREELPGCLLIKEIQIIPNPSSNDILHCTVELPAAISESIAPITLKCFDCHGSEILCGEPLVLIDCTRTDADLPGLFIRTLRFSIEVPATLRSFYLFAHIDDDSIIDGLHSIYPELACELRGRWHSDHLPVEQDERYEQWFLSRRAQTKDLATQRTISRNLPAKPLFSFVVPIYRTPILFFKEMVDSVLAQSYEYFELILVNASPDDVQLSQELDRVAASDERIKKYNLSENLGISENTLFGTRHATGDFLCFLDHDDVLEPDLLYWYAKAVIEKPDIDVLYCDEDKLDNGHYVYPFFKPDWDPFFAETNNYVCHLLAVRKSFYLELPAIRSGYDGAQDHHIVLAASERTKCIHHVGRVLYHWRVHDMSTASDGEQKPESVEAARCVIESHLDRAGVHGAVNCIQGLPHYYSIATYPSRLEKAVTLIVHSDSDEMDVKSQADRIRGELDFECSIKHVASKAGDYLVALDEELDSVGTPYILLADASAHLDASSEVINAVGLLERDGVGLVSGRTVFSDGTLRSAGVVCSRHAFAVPEFGNLPSNDIGARALMRLAHQVSAVEQGFLLLKRNALLSSGWSAKRAHALRWGVDLSLAIRSSGFYVVVDPSMRVEVAYSGFDLMKSQNIGEKFELSCANASLRRRWPAFFSGADPFYSSSYCQDGNYGLA